MAGERVPFDWEASLEGCSRCVIFCHGGCPDGLGAARLACLALAKLGQTRSDIVELEHTDRASKAAGLIGPEAAVLYVDISPYAEDLPLLRSARRVIVIDHHASVGDRMAALTAEMPSAVDLSQLDGDHCAASLVGRELGHLLQDIADIDKKIAILRKKDVWQYQIPSEWASEAAAFIACTQLATCVTLAMIDEFLFDMSTFLAKGAEAVQVLQQNASQLFDQVKVIAEADHPMQLLVIGVEQSEALAYDTRHFAQLCQRYTNAVILRANLYKSSDHVEIRLSCTSEDIAPLGSLAKQLHAKDPAKYVGGGGHPYAAGLQVSRTEYDIECVACDLLHASGAVPEHIALKRRQDALNVASPKPQRKGRAKTFPARMALRSLTSPVDECCGSLRM